MRHRARRRERGAAVFIVVMVIVLLTAIGIVAARSASLVDEASGYSRQALQTYYLTDLAGRVATAEIGSKPQTYLDLMRKGTEVCPSNALVKPVTTGAPIPCYKLFMNEIASRVANNYSGQTLLDPQTQNQPGSLGAPLSSSTDMLNGVFMVEMIDAFKADPKARSDVGGGANSFFDVQVTLTAFGQIRSMPSSGVDTNPWCAKSTGVSSSASVQAIRAHVTLPNIPAQ